MVRFILPLWRWAGMWAVLLAVAALSCAPSQSRRRPADTFSVKSYGAMWDDPARCLSAVQHGRRVPKSADRFRVGTWNIKWFPDGLPTEVRGGGTDIDWLACAIVFLNVDVLALQEIKATPRAQRKLEELTKKLHALSGSRWLWHLDDCPDPTRQHVGILYRYDRASVEHVVSHGAIDPTVHRTDGTPQCPGYLRPALGAHVQSKAGGVSFHFLSIHLDSGRASRDFENRAEAWQRLSRVVEERLALVNDSDVIVAGDFNMMGCEGCSGPATGKEERAQMVRVLAELATPFKVPAPSVACSQYYRGQGELLDQIIHSASMHEAQGAGMLVSGVCYATKCQDIASDQLPAFRHLSDHCPLLLDVVDQSID